MKYMLMYTKGVYSILRKRPNKNLYWEVFIPDAGDEVQSVEKIVDLLNKDADEASKVSDSESKTLPNDVEEYSLTSTCRHCGLRIVAYQEGDDCRTAWIHVNPRSMYCPVVQTAATPIRIK